MPKHSKSRVNIPLCLAALLLCLTMISMHLTGGLYARYVANGSGNDSARVIRFGDLTLTETGDFSVGGTAYFVPGVNLNKTVTVNFNGSESATYVFVTVDVADTWDYNAGSHRFTYEGDKIVLEMDDKWSYLEDTAQPYVFYRILKPNDQLVATPVFANNGLITVSETITKPEVLEMSDMPIDLWASAIQAIGFPDAASAWESLRAKS